MITEIANHLQSKQTNSGLSEASTSVGRNLVYCFTNCYLQLQSVNGWKLGMEHFWAIDKELL